MLTVCDAARHVLSDVVTRPGDDPGCAVILSAANPDALLRHYFRRGRTDVVIVAGTRRVHGRIETRWERGVRTWLIRTETPLPPETLDTAGADASSPGSRQPKSLRTPLG